MEVRTPLYCTLVALLHEQCCELTLTHDVIWHGAPEKQASISSQVHIGAREYW